MVTETVLMDAPPETTAPRVAPQPGDGMKKAPPVTRRVDPQLIADLRARRVKNPKLYTWGYIAEQTGHSEQLLCAAFSDKGYNGSPATIDAIENSIRQWIRAFTLQANAPVARKDFIETAPFEIISGAVIRALETKSAICLSGPAGIGKSEALKFIRAEYDKIAIYLELCSTACDEWAIQAMLDFHLRDKLGDTTTASTKQSAHVNWFKNHKAIIIVDDAHFLQLAGWVYLLITHKLSGVPIILAGNERLLDQLYRARNFQHTAQLRRLVTKHLNVGAPKGKNFPRPEIAAFVAQYLHDAPATLIEEADAIANAVGGGHLGTLDKVLLETQIIIREGSTPLAAFREAWATHLANPLARQT